MISLRFRNIVNRSRKENSERDYDWEYFHKSVRLELIKMKNKGLTIPILTI
jgi:hypothetical protein